MNLISDATLRDGNHAIRHQLGREQIADYARAANAAGIDIVEVGHGNGLGGSSCLLGQTPIDDVLMLETARAVLTTSWLGVHFIPGLGKATDIELAIEAGVDVVRVATHCTEANVSRRFIEQTRRAGRVAYGVLMMSHMAPPEVLLAQARLMQDYGAQAVILMDSAGYSTPNLVREKVRLLVEALRVDVGFHAHNNLGLAVANSLVALEQGARIVDACVKGFGAGAGNTQLETLVAAMEREGHAANTSFERVTALARESEAFLSPKTPHIAAANIVSGLYGLFSGYVPHIQKAALEFGVNEFELYRRLAERRLVAGQEDIITEEASRQQRPRAGPPAQPAPVRPPGAARRPASCRPEPRARRASTRDEQHGDKHMTGLNPQGQGHWEGIEREVLTPDIERQVVNGDALMMARLFLKKGAFVATHSHPNEQFTLILSGRLLFRYGERLEHEAEVGPGGILHLPANLPHNALCLEDAVDLDIFTPPRADWLEPDGNRYFAGARA